ncbi:hypothetical protein PHYBLDRAFT_166647 [Phycomyces blakesleeanus NRRL 1555(-)]|uniref:Uncharacterized protein n=1 Tax=Phycomyces blakesleeanus (strain ATCC 8743b / DSM 1359 / FGSC 10004 / NBRC 33097 / NRRL 1555) TaxID=763407 RepID=A0A163AS18_PHYB8|nr:hypothetical protein PHYBLDRAFT_166647 [Phycomyces blakesleeanus NRRL 1555(-)]OAD75401.1 hypothetical protein PHYBLDRAFT_166647 [Phycomyces blakesleeanus NRRL 1555(-)]|eukprot:XP_018293441.1 hypothetical protein PHYBLDRAFT_166647 [Phycomyces blakesleeanus NRRL 1555(-)]
MAKLIIHKIDNILRHKRSELCCENVNKPWKYTVLCHLQHSSDKKLKPKSETSTWRESCNIAFGRGYKKANSLGKSKTIEKIRPQSDWMTTQVYENGVECEYIS